jgi:hypothetical protein
MRTFQPYSQPQYLETDAVEGIKVLETSICIAIAMQYTLW